MNNPTFLIRFQAQGGAERELHIDSEGRAWPRASVEALGLRVLRKPETWRVMVKPSVDVTITTLEAHIRVDLYNASTLFLNGYNSWTDSVEHWPLDRMRGLIGTPQAAIKRWGLDASGDYRFTKQDARRGYMHGFGYAYLRFDEYVELVGSLNEDSGLTLIREDALMRELVLYKELPARPLQAHEDYELMAFAITCGELGDAVDRWLEHARIARREAPAVVGYSSWYRHYQDITAAKLTHDLEGVREQLGKLDVDPCAKVFQIDDGWTKVGDWLTPDTGDFPEGLAPLASQVVQDNLVPGLWMAPFICETDSRVYAEHPDWIQRDENGEMVRTDANWSGAWALDTRNPEVREHVRASLSQATRDWGFKLLKLDFLYAACLTVRDGMNRGQLIADALDLLRESVPEGTWFDLCGVPMVSAFGRTEFCRIGPDVSLDWDNKLYMRGTHRERVSTRRSLANTRGRAHLDGRAFRCDPDVFFLREDVALTPGQRADLLHADATCGGVFFTSDDMGEWNNEQREAFLAALKTFVAKER